MEKRELIYLDNAATSYPKPYAVSDAVKNICSIAEEMQGGADTVLQFKLHSLCLTAVKNCRIFLMRKMKMWCFLQ